MLTIQLYGLNEHPKTQLLKASVLDALVELPLAFSFVQISTLDAFLDQQLPEIPCLMVNGGLIPTEQTQSVAELRELLRTVALVTPLSQHAASTHAVRALIAPPAVPSDPPPAPDELTGPGAKWMTYDTPRRPQPKSIRKDDGPSPSEPPPPPETRLAG